MKKLLTYITFTTLIISSNLSTYGDGIEILVQDPVFIQDLEGFYLTLAEISEPEIFKFYNQLPEGDIRYPFVSDFLANIRATFKTLSSYIESHPKCIHTLYSSQGVHPIFQQLPAHIITTDNLPDECFCNSLSDKQGSLNHLISLVYGNSVERIKPSQSRIPREFLLLPSFQKIQEFWNKYPQVLQ